MADAVPLISISAEDGGDDPSACRPSAEDLLTDGDSVTMSDGDLEAENEGENEGEDEMRAQSITVSRLRRKIKKKPRTNTNTIFVDDGDEEGVTDVETVECEHDGDDAGDGGEDAGDETQIDQAQLEHVFDAYKPQITEITDDQEGRLHIKTIIRGVVATDISDLSEISDDEDREMMKFQSYREVATDVESMDGSSEDEAAKSDTEDCLHDAINKQFELGGDVHAKEHHEERTGPAYQPSVSLLPPSRTPNRRKTKKSRKIPAAAAKSAALLGAPDANEDPVTDVEDLDTIGEPSVDGGMAAGSLGAPVVDARSTTDVEDLSDGEGAPGITIDCPESGDESGADCFYSGRSSRMELTDVDMDASDASDVARAAASALGLPVDHNDPVTDVEDIDNVEDDNRSPIPPVTVQCTAQSQVIVLEEDEDGVETLVSRKTGAEAEEMMKESAVTDVSGEEMNPESSSVEVTDDAPADADAADGAAANDGQ